MTEISQDNQEMLSWNRGGPDNRKKRGKRRAKSNPSRKELQRGSIRKSKRKNNNKRLKLKKRPRENDMSTIV